MITMSTRPLRILVVDDDPAMVGAITALVGTEGHQVITAYDGLTAVKRFREEHPDLVLLDLAMPGPDGFNVAGQMRAVGPAPILVVSGESGEAAKDELSIDQGIVPAVWGDGRNRALHNFYIRSHAELRADARSVSKVAGIRLLRTL